MFTTGPFETHSYLISCPQTLKACVVDSPPDSFSKIMQVIEERGLSVERILLTHSHWDHIADVVRLKQATKALVCIHPKDVDNLRTPGVDGLASPIPIQGMEPDVLLQDGEAFSVGSVAVKVVPVPGHTLGSVCFYVPNEKKLFSGDTVFRGSMGRVDFPTSSPDLIWDSLYKLSQLPSDTKILPGHGPITTIGQEPWMARAKERFFTS